MTTCGKFSNPTRGIVSCNEGKATHQIEILAYTRNYLKKTYLGDQGKCRKLKKCSTVHRDSRRMELLDLS